MHGFSLVELKDSGKEETGFLFMDYIGTYSKEHVFLILVA